MADLLVAENVVKTFGALRAVDDVSFTVAEGEVLGIAGPNGSGKSTLFNTITGIPYRPNAGRITFDGRRIDQLPAQVIARAGIARTFQTETDFESLSVLDNALVPLVAMNPRAGHAERVRRAEETLAFVGLDGDLSRPASELSVFDRKLLMLGTALALKPRILLLDEPASGLSRPEVLKTSELIDKISGSGVTIMLIEHVISLLVAVSDRLIVLNFGSKLAEGEPETVVRDPSVVEAYLGLGRAMTPLLEVRDLKVGYGRVPVLHGISIALGEYRRIGLIGPNGHGKTTLMRAISGLLDPWDGDILLDGRSIAGSDPAGIVAAGLIHVPQGNALFPYMTVAENLMLGAYAKRARAGRKQALDKVYALFPRLWERRRQECRTLSGGERQMVSIGAALMAQPKILMLDEPTLGLSPKLKLELCDAIDGISKSGVPTIVVEQDINFMLRLTDYFYLIHQGAVSAEFRSEDRLDNAKIMDMYLGLD